MSPHTKILAVLIVAFFMATIASLLGSGRALAVAAGSLIAIGKVGADDGAGA